MNDFTKNFLSLGMLQVMNYLIPLIIVPFVIKKLGVQSYGLLTFAQSIAVFIMVFFDFGFNLIGVDKIAKSKLKSRQNEIFNIIYIIKSVMFVVLFVISLIFIFYIPKLEQNYEVYILFILVSFFQSLFPMWFFQGIEKMKYILYFNVFGKIVTLIIILLFLNTPNDYNIYPIAFLIGFIVSDIMAFYLIYKLFKFKLYMPPIKRVKVIFKSAFKIFSNNFIVKTYSNLNIIILGFFTNNLIVGYYSIAIKLSGVLSAFLGVFLQTIYPKFSKLAKFDFCKYIKSFNKIFIGLTIVSLAVTAIYLIFEKEILSLLIEKIDKDLTSIVAILSILIVASPIGGLFTNFFVVSNEYNKFFKISLLTSIVNFITFAIALSIDKLYALAFTVVITQIAHFVLNIYYYNKVKVSKCVV